MYKIGVASALLSLVDGQLRDVQPKNVENIKWTSNVRSYTIGLTSKNDHWRPEAPPNRILHSTKNLIFGR